MRKLQRVGKVFIGIGLTVAVVAGCCVDSAEPFGKMALLAVLIGGIVAGIGYGMTVLGKPDVNAFFVIHRKDKLDADVEFIDLDKKIAP